MKYEDTFTTTILSPLSIEWEGQVTALESQNSDGAFAIMPDHARFMTLLHNVPIVLYPVIGEPLSFTYREAVLYVEDNEAHIYIHETEVPYATH